MSDEPTIEDRREALENTLFVVLTRPAVFMGVPVVGCLLNVAGSVIAGSWLGIGSWHMLVWWIVLIPAIHGIMRAAVARDYFMFRVAMVWMDTKGQAVIDTRWGGSSLTPLPIGFPKKSKEMSFGG